MAIRIVLIAAAFACLFIAGQEGRCDDAPKTGEFNLKITDRSDASAIKSIVSRMGWGTMDAVRKTGAEVDYDLEGESFEAFVPPDYDGKDPYGLFVWISPGPSGAPPKEWIDVLKKHKLIWVGPNHVENARAVWIRQGLAIDAAEHFRKTYSIDKNRVYISGLSGGGRCASHLGIGFPDIFTGGGCYIIGCNFYRNVDVPGGGKKLYPKSFSRPTGVLIKQAETARRHVFLTGDDDQNRDQTKANYNAAKTDGFKHITYMQVPKMGHQSPAAEAFEEAIEALDDPKAMSPAGKPERVKAVKEKSGEKPGGS